MGLKSRDDPDEPTSMQRAMQEAQSKLLAGKGRTEEKSQEAPAPVVSRQQPAEDPPPVQAVETPTPVSPAVAEEPVRAQPQQARQETIKPASTHKGNTMQQQVQQGTLSERLNNLRKPVSRGTSSARANELAKNIQQAVSDTFNSEGRLGAWAVQTIDGSAGLPFPVIFLTWKLKNDEGINHLTAFGILIEPEDLRIPSRTEKVDQTNFDIITTMGDIYNDGAFSQLVETQLRRVQNLGDGAKIIHAGALRLPVGIKIEDKITQELVFQAVTANWAAMDRYIAVNTEEPFTLLNRDMRSERLVGRLKVSNRPLYNELGEPLRANLIATVDSVRNNQNGTNLLVGNSNISQMAGYCEPVYAQPSTDPTKPRAPFLPGLVITDVRAGNDQTDLESILLSIVNGVQLVSYGNAWSDQFRRQLGTEGMHDLGALGLLTAYGKRYLTNTDEFKANFDSFIREHFVCDQGLVVAMDVADIGPNAWAMDIFRACAAGNTLAIAAFERAMDNLTGNQYSAQAQQAGIKGQSPVIAHGDRRHAGYYPDADGTLRDIREVDLLAVASAFGNNTAPVTTYLESTAPMRGTDNTRAAERYGCIDDVLQGSQVTTGYYTRMYFQPKALPTMARACALAKLVIQPDQIAHGLGSAQRMNGFDFAGLLSQNNPNQFFGTSGTSGAPTYRW